MGADSEITRGRTATKCDKVTIWTRVLVKELYTCLFSKKNRWKAEPGPSSPLILNLQTMTIGPRLCPWVWIPSGPNIGNSKILMYCLIVSAFHKVSYVMLNTWWHHKHVKMGKFGAYSLNVLACIINSMVYKKWALLTLCIRMTPLIHFIKITIFSTFKSSFSLTNFT